ncbi:hypothetical protein J437_LFUL001615 [Ladona fulva]|uniref:Uncharacterized protein n=1 Tax=Ladona fulva TaxID=123851 RepID=A0A8K0KLP9_LADFU|nr:hypothetical protein J437_LFUL001615 [Ladona fulva]
MAYGVRICRTCIVRYLETSRFCPICDVLVHKAKPLMHIRPDKMLQALVYKIVPGLFHSEVRKRRDFWAKTREPAVGAGGGVLTPEEEAEEEEEEREEVAAGAGGGSFFSAEDSISLSLEYYDSERAAAEEEDDDEEDDDEMDEENETKRKTKTLVERSKDELEQIKVMRRYLKCPAAVTMLHLKKFIRMKYGIGEDNRFLYLV